MIVRFQPVPSVISDIDSYFGIPFPSFQSAGRVRHTSRVMMKESDTALTVVAELPGVAKEDVTIQVNEDVLTISAERKQPELQEHEQLIRNEINYGKIERTVNLPYMINADNVSATFVNGILRIELPKHENAKPKQIEIR